MKAITQKRVTWALIPMFGIVFWYVLIKIVEWVLKIV